MASKSAVCANKPAGAAAFTNKLFRLVFVEGKFMEPLLSKTRNIELNGEVFLLDDHDHGVLQQHSGIAMFGQGGTELTSKLELLFCSCESPR